MLCYLRQGPLFCLKMSLVASYCVSYLSDFFVWQCCVTAARAWCLYRAAEREEAAQRVSLNSPPTSARQRAASSFCSTGFGEFLFFSWNTHIHHCRGHKQLSINPNPLFRINKSFSHSFLRWAVTFLWLMKFNLADGALHDAWQVTYIGVSNPLQCSRKQRQCPACAAALVHVSLGLCRIYVKCVHWNIILVRMRRPQTNST